MIITAIAATLTLLGAHGHCATDYVVRGIRYELCTDGAYVTVADNDRLNYKVSFSTWVQSQTDTSLGDDERLGA